jgi:putative transposase
VGSRCRLRRFTEAQIISILKGQEAREKTAGVCRRHGVSKATFYKWKAKYVGLEVSDAQRLKPLEAANAGLKRIVADEQLDIVMLKDVAAGQW